MFLVPRLCLGAKKIRTLQKLFLINAQLHARKLTLLLNSYGTQKRGPFDQILSRRCIGGSGNETILHHGTELMDGNGMGIARRANRQTGNENSNVF